LDVMQLAAQGRAGEPPTRVYITINGSAQEMQALMQKIEAALYDGPQALEVISANGVPCRIVVDRLGEALIRQ
jgi:hypothetical protein